MVIIFCVFLESNLCDILCSKMYQICIIMLLEWANMFQILHVILTK